MQTFANIVTYADICRHSHLVGDEGQQRADDESDAL